MTSNTVPSSYYPNNASFYMQGAPAPPKEILVGAKLLVTERPWREVTVIGRAARYGNASEYLKVEYRSGWFNTLRREWVSGSSVAIVE